MGKFYSPIIFLMKIMREIDRNPITPRLNPKARALLTKLCFRKDNIPKKVDGIFVFSSLVDIKKEVKLIEKILNKGISKKVFITGGIINQERARELKIDKSTAEADLILNYLDIDKFKDVCFYFEKKSTNTLENVTETLKNPEFKKCKSLLFIFKSHAAGRGYLTLRKFLPSAEILQLTFNCQYEQRSKSITRNNWHSTAFSRSRVWGEYLRIKKYGSRGDIEHMEVKNLLNRIEKEI